jgi:4-amino-4-deoxy-L-arabinose transferase-like glycosyltransferase
MAKQLGVARKHIIAYQEELKKQSAVEESEASDSKMKEIVKKLKSWLKKLVVFENKWAAFFLVVGLAFVLRLIHLLEVMDTPFFIRLHTDPSMYNRWATQIADGDWASTNNPVFYLGPLYPYFLAVIYSLFGSSPFAACLIQVILSAATCGLLYFLARRLFGHSIGLIAGLLAAFYGMFVFYSSLVLGATLILFLDVALLFFLVSGMQKPIWWKWCLAGLCLGFSAAARGNILLFAPLAGLSIIVYFGFSKVNQWLVAGAWMLVAFFIAVSPLALHNWLVGDDPVLLTSSAGANFYIGNHPDSRGLYINSPVYKKRPLGLSVRDQQINFPQVAKEELGRSDLKPSEVSAFWIDKTFETIGDDFGHWLSIVGNKIKYYLNAYEVPNNRNYYFSKRFAFVLNLPLVTFGLILPLALLGMAVGIRTIKKHGVLTYFFVANLVALVAFFVNARYRLVVVPVLLIYTALALAWLKDVLSKQNWKHLATAAGSLLLLYLFVFQNVMGFSFRANFLNLGNAYRDLGNLERAIENYDLSIRHSATPYYYGYFKKGEVLSRLGRNEEAKDVLKIAQRIAKARHDKTTLSRIERRLKQLEAQ